MSTQWCRKKGKVICTFQDSKDSKSNLLTVPTPENKEWGFGNFFNKTTISQFSETGRWHGHGGGEHGGEGSGQGGGVDLGSLHLSYFFPWTFEKTFLAIWVLCHDICLLCRWVATPPSPPWCWSSTCSSSSASPRTNTSTTPPTMSWLHLL